MPNPIQPMATDDGEVIFDRVLAFAACAFAAAILAAQLIRAVAS